VDQISCALGGCSSGPLHGDKGASVLGRRGEDDVVDALMRTRRRWTGHPRNTAQAPCFSPSTSTSIRLDCSLLLAPSSTHQAQEPSGGWPAPRTEDCLSDSINSSGYDSRPRPTTTVAILILYLLSSIFNHIYAANVDYLSLIRFAGTCFCHSWILSTRHYPCWTRAYAGQAQSFVQHHSSRNKLSYHHQ